MRVFNYLFSVTFIGVLVICFGCSSDDGEGAIENFAFNVLNGENTDPNNFDPFPIEGASIEVYTSSESYFNGDSPIKTLTTGADGAARSNDVFPSSAVVYAKSGNFNNWPNLSELTPDNSGRMTGTAIVYRSFKADFESVQNINFTISEVLINDASSFTSLSDCSKDNYVVLTSGANYTYSEGSNVCDGFSGGDYTISGVASKNNTNTEVVGGVSCYQFITDWSNLYSSIYISMDFSQIIIKDFDSGSAQQIVTIYSK